MKNLIAICLLTLLIGLGCGPSTQSVRVQPPAPEDTIKSTLTHLTETGVIDSGIVSLEESIEKLKETDPDKGNELAADLEKLKSTRNPAAVKSQAQTMLDKL